MSAPARPPTLAGLRVLVPESRELDLFVAMLERAGAGVLRCSLVTILDVEDDAPVVSWLRRLVDGVHDDLVFYTGEGVRRLLAVAARHGIEAPATAALGRARMIVRGPKPIRALRTIGLVPEVAADDPTTAGLIEVLRPLPLAGRRIGVQLYPEQSPEFAAFLTGQGAAVDPVLPYRYADDREDGRVVEAIGAMEAGLVDVVAFTSTPQVRRLDGVARANGLSDALARARERVRVAAIGPVTAEALAKAGWRAIVSPADRYHLKPFIAAIAAAIPPNGPPREEPAGE